MVFNIYVKLMEEVFQRFGLNWHKCVEDAQLYLMFPADTRNTVETTNKFLEVVLGRIKINEL